mgnify:CR=1 FL=1
MIEEFIDLVVKEILAIVVVVTLVAGGIGYILGKFVF